MNGGTEHVGIERIVQSIQNSGAINILLWAGSLLGGAIIIGWVLFGGPSLEARQRADAVSDLWPVVLAWTSGLVFKSKVTGDQKREVVKADSALKVLRHNTADRAAMQSRAERTGPPRAPSVPAPSTYPPPSGDSL